MMDIETALTHIPLFAGRRLQTHRINGGITNVNWRVVDPQSGETFFVKLHGAGTAQYIDRKMAFAAGEMAARRGIGPQILFHDEALGIEVHEFLEGFTSCTIQDIHDEAIRAHIMGAYRTIHTNLKLERTDTGLAQLEAFIGRVAGQSEVLPRDIDHLIWQARRAAAAITASGVDVCGCYNDPYISNYMRNAAGEIRIIDWEYASNNDPYWDIGMFCFETFHEDSRSIAGMLEMYEGQAREDLVARTFLNIGVAKVRWGLWAAYQHKNATIAFDFAKYARFLLMRARWQFAQSDWERALSHV